MEGSEAVFFSITRTTISLGPLSPFPQCLSAAPKKSTDLTRRGEVAAKRRTWRSVRGRKTLQSQRCSHFNHQLHHRC